MFKHLMTLILVFSMLTVSAGASTTGLKAAFDEMTYSLTVEWDQADKDFYNAQVERFTQKVSELQKSGLTNEELIEFAKKEIKSEKVAADFEAAMSVVLASRMEPVEARNYVMGALEKSYHQGASWNGSTFLSVALGIGVVAIIVAIVATAKPCESNCGGGYYDPYYPYPYYPYDPWYYDPWYW